MALIVGVSGACRSDELFKMKTTDIDVAEKTISIIIPNTKTYNPRSFVVTNPEWIKILKNYIHFRNEVTVEGDKLFLQFRFGRITKQHLGHNSISQFPKKIASYLSLPDVNSFTGHCFRRTAATLLANTGGDVLQLKKLGGWKSSSVAEGYVDSSLDGQIKIANLLSPTSSAATTSSAAASSTKPATVTSSSSTRNVQIEGMSSTPCVSSVSTNSTNATQFNFSTGEMQHGLQLTFNTHDQANVSIHFNTFQSKKPS